MTQLLGRVSMYRLVALLPLALAGVMVTQTALGVFAEPFTVPGLLLTLAVLLIVSVLGNELLGRALGLRPHRDSAVITALLLFFLFWPTTDPAALAWTAGAAVLAAVSKYLIVWRGRHLLNPAATGAAGVALLQWGLDWPTPVTATWWVASEPLLPYVVVAALVVLWRVGPLGVALVFLVVAGGLQTVALVELGNGLGAAARTALVSSPVVFLAGFMLTEPLTLPPRRAQQYGVAVVVAVAFAVPLLISAFGTPTELLSRFGTPEVALLVGNLVAFALARRTGVLLTHRETRPLGGDVVELAFATERPLRFRPGQYLELHLPHAGADGRGVRRPFSLSSPPGAELATVAVRVPERSSTFKTALGRLAPGDRVRATGVRGDFLLPADPAAPVVLVAGGIGVTPFLSQLRDRPPENAVLVYGVPDAAAVPYADELVAVGVPVVLVTPRAPADLPAGWSRVAGDRLSAQIVVEAVPDLAERRAYLSGPPAMVTALRRGLRGRTRGVRTDVFTGY